MSFSIRFADVRDVPVILRFIRELAEYENLLSEVVADESTLRQSLFEEQRGRPEVLIAEEEKKPIGFVLFFHNFSTFIGRKGIYVEDLYVTPECRGKGYGEKILAEVCRIAKERNCGRVEWWVLDWNERAINFYKRIGAVPMSEWTVFRLSESGLRRVGSQ